jgi:D-glycero-alpha-D-manno-heptose-7-phosphate kinase
VNFAVDRYTHCRITLRKDRKIILASEDLGRSESFASLNELMKAKKYKLGLHAWAIHHFAPWLKTGFELWTKSEAPAGAGISGSSALLISVVSAFNKLAGTRYSLEKTRETAQNIEAQIINVPTGCQDYYPALYGGVSAVELGVAGIARKGIDVDLEDFNARIVLAYTGEPRNSGINNWEVTKAHIAGDRAVWNNFRKITEISIAMRSAVEKANWKEAGRLLREEWANRRKNAPGITTPLIDKLIDTTRKQGALGGKVCGAGGGGCVFFLVEPGAQERVRKTIAILGATVLPVQVAPQGVRVH